MSLAHQAVAELQSAHEYFNRSTRNLAEVGELILSAALHRKESRGWHFRKDYPYTDNKNWLKWVTLTRQGDEISFVDIPVPTPRKVPTAEITVPPGVRRQ